MLEQLDRLIFPQLDNSLWKSMAKTLGMAGVIISLLQYSPYFTTNFRFSTGLVQIWDLKNLM